jgi:hypothetical protein
MKPVLQKNLCLCRNCGAHYDENKSRADWKGYCTQACVHEKARKHGYQKSREKFGSGHSEYDVLHRANLIGSVFLDKDGSVIDEKRH